MEQADNKHNIIDPKNLHAQLKAIVEGCCNPTDTIDFSNYYCRKYPQYADMINSYFNGAVLLDDMNIKSKQIGLSDVVACNNREDSYDITVDLISRSSDYVYKTTLETLATMKTYKKKVTRIVEKKQHSTRICPHCSHIASMPTETTYVICGYSNPCQGYDWKGCGSDWCFACGQKLCKKWESDMLNLQANRNHDTSCCKERAQELKHDYKKDYCQCNNSFVHRGIESIMESILTK